MRRQEQLRPFFSSSWCRFCPLYPSSGEASSRTCLTGGPPTSRPLAQLARHSCFGTTKRRYVHLQADAVCAAFERARSQVEGGLTARAPLETTGNQWLNSLS